MTTPDVYGATVTAVAVVEEVFRSKSFGNIAGVSIQGTIRKGAPVSILRNDELYADGLSVHSLRRYQFDYEELSDTQGGIGLGPWDDIQIGDQIIQEADK